MQQPITLCNAGTPAAAIRWPGGKGLLNVTGSFNGASLQLQAAAKDLAGGASIATRNIGSAITATGTFPIDLPVCSASVTLTGGASPTVTAIAQPIVES